MIGRAPYIGLGAVALAAVLLEGPWNAERVMSRDELMAIPTYKAYGQVSRGHHASVVANNEARRARQPEASSYTPAEVEAYVQSDCDRLDDKPVSKLSRKDLRALERCKLTGRVK